MVLLKIFWDDMLPIILLNYLHSFKFFLYKVSSICWKAENQECCTSTWDLFEDASLIERLESVGSQFLDFFKSLTKIQRYGGE